MSDLDAKIKGFVIEIECRISEIQLQDQLKDHESVVSAQFRELEEFQSQTAYKYKAIEEYDLRRPLGGQISTLDSTKLFWVDSVELMDEALE